MWKLSQNIVLNVYNSLQSSFCHLLGLGQVGHSPRRTSGSTGTLDWGPIWLGSQLPCHHNTPLTPPTPTDAPKMAPTTPKPLGAPNAPDALYTPSGPWVPRVSCPCQPPIHSWHPLHPDAPSDTPKWPPTPPRAPQCPWCPLYPFLYLNT